MEAVLKLVEELQGGLKTLQDTHAQAKKDSDALIDQKLDRVTSDIALKYETLQTEQQKLIAVIERGGLGGEGSSAVTAEEKASAKAFDKFIRYGKSALSAEEIKAMSTDVNPQGGYLVPTQQLGLITGRIFETSPLRQFATVVKTSAKSVSMILDDNEADSGWIGEGDTPAETGTPNLGEFEIACHKQYAYPKMTEELIQDAAFPVDSWLNDKLVDKFGRVENQGFLTGDGIKQPRGLLTYPAWASPGVYERKALERINSGSTSAPTEGGLIDIQVALKEAYQGRARWGFNRDTFGKIMKLNGANSYRFLNMQPTTGTNGLGLGGVLSLMGKPVSIFADMPNIATDSLSILYGDLSTYMIVDRVGISVRQDAVTSPGMVKFWATKRVGGALTNFEGIKLQRFNT